MKHVPAHAEAAVEHFRRQYFQLDRIALMIYI